MNRKFYLIPTLFSQTDKNIFVLNYVQSEHVER